MFTSHFWDKIGEKLVKYCKKHVSKYENDCMSIIHSIWNENNVSIIFDTIFQYIVKYDLSQWLQFLLLDIITKEDIKDTNSLQNDSIITYDFLESLLQNNTNLIRMNRINRCNQLLYALMNDCYKHDNFDLFMLLLKLNLNEKYDYNNKFKHNVFSIVLCNPLL